MLAHEKSCSINHRKVQQSKDEVTFTSEQKRIMSVAALEFVAKDLRPFAAIEGAGFLSFLREFSEFCNTPMDEQQIKRLLPSRYTVSQISSSYQLSAKHLIWFFHS